MINGIEKNLDLQKMYVCKKHYQKFRIYSQLNMLLKYWKTFTKLKVIFLLKHS